jgi:hypothetical protein
MQFGCWGKLRGGPKGRLEDSMMMDLQEVGCEDWRWMDLADVFVRCGGLALGIFLYGFWYHIGFIVAVLWYRMVAVVSF